MSGWTGDESPADHPYSVCDEDGCWCYLSDGKMRMCHCTCHDGDTPLRRTKWNGERY